MCFSRIFFLLPPIAKDCVDEVLVANASRRTHGDADEEDEKMALSQECCQLLTRSSYDKHLRPSRTPAGGRSYKLRVSGSMTNLCQVHGCASN